MKPGQPELSVKIVRLSGLQMLRLDDPVASASGSRRRRARSRARSCRRRCTLVSGPTRNPLPGAVGRKRPRVRVVGEVQVEHLDQTRA